MELLGTREKNKIETFTLIFLMNIDFLFNLFSGVFAF